jgi:lipopolysaccharide heptosyltransferase II
MNLNYARYVDRWIGLLICLLLFAFERATRPWTGRPIRSLLATTPPDDEPLPAPRRVLCMKFYGLGNMIMLLPVLEALQRRHPQAEIDFMTMTTNTPLLERSGDVTRTIGVDVSSTVAFLRSFWAAIQVVRARRYDTVIDFEQFVKISCIIGFLTGARERIGFNTDGQRRGFMYTRRVVYTDSDHMSAIFARLLRPLDVVGALPMTTLDLAPAEVRSVDAFLADHGVAEGQFPLVAMHLGIGMNFYRVPLKRWDPENFAAVGDALAERWGARIVLTGSGAEERRLNATARAAMRHPALDTCDRFDVMELAALLARCHLVVANDTSVMHLAALVGTPVVAIFGPTAPLHYGPRGERHLVFYRDLYSSPCLTNYNLKVSRCLDPVCMRGISPAMVVERIAEHYLDEGAPHGDWLRARSRASGAA